ncbi:hypothetical protein [Paenibacillus sp. FSL H8-0537]|uniref:hypothetical protein n=1 Tax=Paenibacillus sp. FSL H8-0537 TaxID=2921399 RepID=UPI003100D7C7
MKFKSIISFIVLISMLVASSSVYATAPIVKENIIPSQTQAIYSQEGELIALRTLNIQSDTKINKEGTSIKLTQTIHYEFSSPEFEAKYKSEYENTNYVEHYFVNKNNEIYHDDVKMTDEELKQEISITPNPSGNLKLSALSNDANGIPAICHYYGDYSTYTMACYDRMNFENAPGGNNIKKTSSIQNVYAVRAMNTIDIFYGDYKTFQGAKVAFSSAALTAIFTIETVILAIAAGGGAAIAGVTAITYYNICNGDLEKAYGYLKQI